jgi:hypothetical protein
LFVVTIIGYHGTNGQALPHIGFCVTPDQIAALHYAGENGGCDVTEIVIDTTDLDVEDVAYDYDGCEPKIDGVTADIAEYTDCDEHGRTHRTWMLLTDRAVAAAHITGIVEVAEF